MHLLTRIILSSPGEVEFKPIISPPKFRIKSGLATFLTYVPTYKLSIRRFYDHSILDICHRHKFYLQKRGRIL